MKNRKRIISALIMAAILLSVSYFAYAAGVTKNIEVAYTGVSIYVEGKLIDPRDANGNPVEPFIYEGTTYLPVRAISEALGKPVDWNAQANRIDIDDPNRETKVVTVKTAEEFIAALNSDTHILMEPGTYNLSSASISPRANVVWDSVFDGRELHLDRIKNLTIEGKGATPVNIVIEPRYAFVLNFTRCESISIKNITAGHTDDGYCQGGVFAFSDSKNISIDSVNMYGCGTEGLRLLRVQDMSVADSSVYECTYSIMTVEQSEDIAFYNCIFRDNEQFSLVNIISTDDLLFSHCQFNNNKSNSTFFEVQASTDIEVFESSFEGNTAKQLHYPGSIINLLETCTFTNNNFE